MGTACPLRTKGIGELNYFFSFHNVYHTHTNFRLIWLLIFDYLSLLGHQLRNRYIYQVSLYEYLQLLFCYFG